jgi:hypothetical protein
MEGRCLLVETVKIMHKCSLGYHTQQENKVRMGGQGKRATTGGRVQGLRTDILRKLRRNRDACTGPYKFQSEGKLYEGERAGARPELAKKTRGF